MSWHIMKKEYFVHQIYGAKAWLTDQHYTCLNFKSQFLQMRLTVTATNGQEKLLYHRKGDFPFRTQMATR